MNADAKIKVGEQDKLFKYSIDVGNYGQNMYYIDTEERICDCNHDTIDRMLLQNQAVGFIGGYFDDRMTICMIDGLAYKTLGYSNLEDFLCETKPELLNMAGSDEEAEYIQRRLQKTHTYPMGCSLKGKDGKTVALRMGNAVITSQLGRKMWYVSIRGLGELHHDSLTGGYNRHGFISYIKNLKSSGVDLNELAILSTNIQGFKAINDLYGSDFGDTMLISVYYHFDKKIKPIICARKEADKFLMLVRRDKLDLAQLPETLKIPYTYGDKEHYINCVCGIYYIDDDKADVNTMIDCAKMAKERIIDAFIKPYAIFEPSMKSDYLRRISALADFDGALKNNEFRVFYQPVIDAKTHKIISAEALIRWVTAGGIISPAIFIPALEENGSIVRLDEYVFETVVMYQRRRAEKGLPLVPVSINISRMDFFDRDRTQRVYKLLERDEIARNYIHFEITETSYRSIKNLQEEFIKKVVEYGGKVYIDDFGVANSSIDMLSLYDFGILKLDMGFVRDMVKNQKVSILIETTIHMAHRLNLKVVAEGVETEEQLDLLRSFECDYIQGYYFSKPLCEADFTEYLKMNH